MSDTLPPELRTTLTGIADHLVRIDAELKSIRTETQQLRVELAGATGRISQLPTIWNMAAILLAMMALAIAGQAGVLVLAGRILVRAGG